MWEHSKNAPIRAKCSAAGHMFWSKVYQGQDNAMQGPIDLRGKETLKTLRHRESHLLCSNLDRLVDPCLLHASILHPAHGCTRIFVELCAWYWVGFVSCPGCLRS